MCVLLQYSKVVNDAVWRDELKSFPRVCLLRGRLTNMPSHRHEKSARQLVKSSTLKATRCTDSDGLLAEWVTQTSAVKNVAIWLRCRQADIVVGDVTLVIVSWLIGELTFCVSDLACRCLCMSATWPATVCSLLMQEISQRELGSVSQQSSADSWRQGCSWDWWPVPVHWHSHLIQVYSSFITPRGSVQK